LPVTTCLFDLDGTLIDSIPLIVESFRHTVVAHGRPLPPDEAFIRGIGTPLDDQLREFAVDEEQVAAMRETYSRYYIDNHNASVQAFAGVLEALTTLKARGTKLGIITSKKRVGALRAVRHCELEPLLDIIVGADDTHKNKPDPEPVLYALTQLRVAASETFFVGDSPHDMAAGRAAGVKIAAVTWGPFPPETLEPYEPDRWLETASGIVDLISS